MPKSRSSDGWWWSLPEAEFDASLPEEEAEEDDGIQRDRGLNIAGPRELWPVTALQLRFDKSWCETDTYNCERFTTLRHSRLVRKKMGGGSLLTRMLLSGYSIPPKTRIPPTSRKVVLIKREINAAALKAYALGFQQKPLLKTILPGQ